METGPVRQKLSRDFRIDCLRGLSILSVLVLHFQLAYNLLKSPVGRFLPGPYLSNLVWNGNYGVVVFFVISGYLITSTSLRRFGSLGEVSVRVFYAFRFARILPCLLLVLTVISGLAWAGVSIFQDEGGVPLWLADLSVLTFSHNILMAKFGYFNYCLNIFWSLSVEEVFYLAFPLLCLLLRRSRWVMLVWLAAIVTGPVYRSLNSHNEIKFLYGNLACFDAISMGCWMAVLVRRVSISRNLRNVLQAAALTAMLVVFLRAGIDSTPVWGPSWMALGAAAFLFAEGAGNVDLEHFREECRPNFVGRVAFLSRKSHSEPNFMDHSIPEIALVAGQSWLHTLASPLAWMGKLSYELYLFHIVLLAGMRTILNPHQTPPNWNLPTLIAFMVASAMVAWAVARFYSEPLNLWLRARIPKTAPPGAA